MLSARHRIDGRMYAVKRIRIKRVGLGGFVGGRVARALQKRFVFITIAFMHRYDCTFVVTAREGAPIFREYIIAAESRDSFDGAHADTIISRNARLC